MQCACGTENKDMGRKESKKWQIPPNLKAEVGYNYEYIRFDHHLLRVDSLFDFASFDIRKELETELAAVPSIWGGEKLVKRYHTHYVIWGRPENDECEDEWLFDYKSETEAQLALMFLTTFLDELSTPPIPLVKEEEPEE